MRLNEKEQDMYPEDRNTLLEALKAYRTSMTEFTEDQMDYLIKLVERDLKSDNPVWRI